MQGGGAGGLLVETEGAGEVLAPPVAAQEAVHDMPFVRFSATSVLDTPKLCKAVGLPHGALLRPFAPTAEPLPLLRRTPLQCSQCQAHVSRHCKLSNEASGSQWWCTFCGKANPFLKSVSDSSREDFPELTCDAVDYLDPTDQPPVYRSSHPSQNPTYVFVLDTNAQRADMESLTSAIGSSLELLPENAQVVLVVFSNVVRVYELGVAGASSAEVFPGMRMPTEEERESLRVKASRFRVPLKLCKANLQTALRYWASALPKEQPALGKRGLAQHQRCLAVALTIALEFIKPDSGDVPEARLENYVGGRVVACISGCPNYGPGGVNEGSDDDQDVQFQVKVAAQIFRKLARIAFLHNFSIDVYCIGLHRFRVNLLQSLVLSNGGVVLLIKDYKDSVLMENLHASVMRTVGRNGSFTVRTTDGLAVTHVIGPAVATDSFVEADSSTFSQCTIATVDPSIGFAVFFRVTGDIVTEHADFQFVVKFTNSRGQNVTRIFTPRLGATGTEARFYKAVDPSALSVLISKRYVLEARKKPQDRLDDVTESLDKAASRMLARAAEANGSIPPCVEAVVLQLFLLRRGPMLGPILQHSDDIDCVRCLFLQAEFSSCSRILQPAFFNVLADGTLQQVRIENVALRPNRVLLLDHFTDIFIWSGRNTVGPEFDAMRARANTLALEMSAARFPRPYVMQFGEGHSMARWLLCRLVPSHKDPRESILASFPELALLPAHEVDALLHFHDTDDESYLQYRGRLA
mmetsp:Transcript_19608/g.75269  ORF Transcript_19608/g.75269 Transcript_19608/m.75269 type:complete len:749 (-) Transcript_19608:25-2271(-)